MATLNQVSFPSPENIDCPKCGETIKLYDPEGSEFCVCQSCNSFIRFTPTSTKGTAQKQVQPIKEKPIIPLGTEGLFKNHKFKVIAYLEKKEKDTIYTWKEYILYNYEKGYATLAEFNGHWNFIVDKTWESTLEKAYSNAFSATHQNVDYRIFNRYVPETTALIGEFDWDVLADKPNTNEYIAPPFLLSREIASPGKTAEYYWGEYTEPKEIAEAFGLAVDSFPAKDGIGANQPSPHAVNFDTLAKYTMLAILGMLLLHFIIKVVKPEKELINKDYTIAFENKGLLTHLDSIGGVTLGPGTYEFKPFVTQSFNQPDASTVLEVEVRSFINNNWLEATVVLVNEKTNETWEVSKGLEYYNGWEGGESWSEGSQTSSIVLTEIPEGKYHFNIYSASGDATQNTIQLIVRSNITHWRNILLTILVLSLYPVYCWSRMRNYEKKRWMNSDHSPYESE